MAEEDAPGAHRLKYGLGRLAELASVPPGSYDVNLRRPWWRWWQPTERGGWLIVERKPDGGTTVMWTTDKDTHFPHSGFGCARSLSMKADGTLVAYFESAITMWIKWGLGRGEDADLMRAMDFADWAHRRLCGSPTKAQVKRQSLSVDGI